MTESGGSSDKGYPGRRSGVERRQFLYSFHLPERRSSSDRRLLRDRRKKYERRCFSRRGLNQNDRSCNPTMRYNKFRSEKDRRSR